MGWRHFKELLLGNLDKNHSQYRDVRSHLEGLLHGLRAADELGHIASGAGLKEATQAIFDKYTRDPGNAVVLLRGRNLRRG